MSGTHRITTHGSLLAAALLTLAMMSATVAGCGARSAQEGYHRAGGSQRDAGAADVTGPRDVGPWPRDVDPYAEGPVARDGRIWVPDARPPPPPPPDLGPLPDGQPCASEINTPCSSSADCCGGLSCLPLGTGVNVCTRHCQPDDPSTPLVNEDSCPDLFQNRCVEAGYQTVCARICQPRLGGSDCAPGLACQPRSNYLAGDLDLAVCVFPACKSNHDCPVLLAKSCNPNNPTSCSGLVPGAFCSQTDHGDHRCAAPGVCDQASGLCAPHALGAAGAKVGSPCTDDRGCGGQMRCELQGYSGGAPGYPNGYCVIEGCSFAATLAVRACPSGAACMHAYPGGWCLKTCDLEVAADCRDHPADAYGDYDCYAWNNLSVGGNKPVADQPVCDGSRGELYEFIAQYPDLGCWVLGLLHDNPTNMYCRNPTDGSIVPDGAPGCRCLDETASNSLPEPGP